MVYGPFKVGAYEVRQDDGTNFVRVGYGHFDGTPAVSERWWLYKTSPVYTAPGVSEPGLVTRFIPIGNWSLSTWLSKATTSHPITGGSHTDGHPESPGLMHDGDTARDYVKGERDVLATFPGTVAKVRQKIPGFPKPDSCSGTIWSQYDPGLLRIRPIGSTTLTLGFVFVELVTPKTSGITETVEYWLLFDDDDFWERTEGSFEVVQVEDAPGSEETSFNQTIYDLFDAEWADGVSSLTIVALRTYSCSEVDPM